MSAGCALFGRTSPPIFKAVMSFYRVPPSFQRKGSIMAARVSVSGIVVLAGAILLSAWPASAQEPKAPPDVRNARYCEILPLSVTVEGLKASVYNTLGHDDCPKDKWEALSAGELRRYFGVLDVVKNGPRYFLMDRIIAAGATAKGEVIDLGGIVLEKRAEVFPSLRQAMEPPFTEQTIDRQTTYRFDAGKPVFELTGPDGSVYVMQSYAQIVDPSLTYDDLPKLQSRLKLPEGWSYATRTPDQDLLLVITGKATVVQDNLKNTYQKIERD